MELESEDGGTRIPVESSIITKPIGREIGLYFSDRTVSRRQLSLQLLPPQPANRGTGIDPDVANRLSFEVVGKNPILVIGGGDGERRVFRVGEKGELGSGDRLSLSLKNPRLLLVKKVGVDGGGELDNDVLDAVRRREERTLRRRREKEVGDEDGRKAKVSGGGGEEENSVAELDLGFEPLDLSSIDPVKEFGFLERGHEFDRYPRKMIRAIKDWNWFLDEDLRETSDSDEELEAKVHRRKMSGKRKRKGEDNVDEEWRGESEDENKLVTHVGIAKRGKYSTRSKDKRRQNKNGFSGIKQTKDKVSCSRKYDMEEDDETLGGFIVNEEEEDEDNLEEVEDEEEEFKEEEDDDE